MVVYFLSDFDKEMRVRRNIAVAVSAPDIILNRISPQSGSLLNVSICQTPCSVVLETMIINLDKMIIRSANHLHDDQDILIYRGVFTFLRTMSNVDSQGLTPNYPE